MENDIVFERWECTICGLPCRVEVIANNAKLPQHVKDSPRFRKQCICNEDKPEWKRTN